MMVKVFHDKDGDLHVLSGETVTLIGFGIQGRAQAENLRDSGVSVIIGNRDDQFRQRAIAADFEPTTLLTPRNAATSSSS
jgi:ketol-acid reductoisomerase